MNQFYSCGKKLRSLMLLGVCILAGTLAAHAQPATLSVPVGIGKPCGGSSSLDSLKYFNYSSKTLTLTHRSNCKPNLSSIAPFSSNLATITFNPFDGYLYFNQIKRVAGIYSTYAYRWLPTVCPSLPAAALPVYQTFYNQFVAGVEFDPSTGLGYQINFVDSTGYPPNNPDAANKTGMYTSAAVVSGNPAMAYYESQNGDLRYVRSSDANGILWNVPVSIDVTGTTGQFLSMAIVNGNPAISYYDATNKDLRYVRATSADGSTWGTPVTIASANDVGMYTSLVVINGNPAISYYDATNGDLQYVRATDASGTTWGTPVTIESINNVGQYTSMAVVNGNPAISYYDVTNLDLRYVRANDATGTTWGTPLAVESTNDVGSYASLAVVNGNPAIAYYDVTNQDLRYIRSADASGAAWSGGIAAQSTGNIGSYCSMKIINGNPAISFYDATNSDLKYTRAGDANGAAWGTPVIGEATGNVGQYTSLFVVSGLPAIGYYDVSNTDVKYVQSVDVNGSVWYSNTGISKMELQQVNFTSGTLGVSKPINFGNHYVYKQNGDVAMTPGRQMLACFDNKYFTVNWQDYSTSAPLVATFIDTLSFGANNNLVGLSYTDGKLVGSIQPTSGSGCFYRELDILTGAQTPVTYAAGSTIFGSADMTNIPAGIGAAKKLVSATESPAGSKTYNIVYEVVIKNYGGTPINNIQAYDTLAQINGAGNVISGSITSFSAPSGISANTSYDGKTAGNFSLLTPGAVLSNKPGQNTITLQITCRISNINPGIVYNNQAVVTGSSIFGDNLRDSSTNGSNPDLNLNDKPDDIGESQPTPLLIAITPQTPPCSVLTNVLYTQDFGSGTGLSSVVPAPVVASGVTGVSGGSPYTSSVTQPIPVETYSVTNNTNLADNARWLSITDHTGNTNGRMLVVNADANNAVFYKGTFTYGLCANQQYSLAFYATFVGNSNYQTVCNAFGGFQYPRVKMRIRDITSGGIITEVSTTLITNTTWQLYGLKFLLPVSYNNILIELINDAPGGCGNDIAIDDIKFGTCDALPVVSLNGATAGCLGTSTTFSASLTDPTALPGTKDYQWQYATSSTGPWTNISGATADTYTINPINPSDTGKYYRVLVAGSGNITNPYCSYGSPSQLLSGKRPSVAPASATKNKNNICPGIAVSLGITGGTLGTNAQWKWYAANCSGTAVGSGTSISVSPTVTTTYYIRAEGECNTTVCQSVTVFISCDIDKDKDGIPDYVESYIPAATANAFNTSYAGYVDNNNDYINDNFQADGDSDGDGTPNYLDTDFAGRVDSNADGVDDRFDFDLDGVINMLDLDSDNDGIPDVVEAGGVDTNGDGKIDNFTDTDSDGLSQNVDGNATGANTSGAGLGALDLDGDGFPNATDLDSDGDGIPDVVEVGGTYVNSNNDGMLSGFTDTNADGISDNVVAGNALLKTGNDTNNDGKADSYPNKNMDYDSRANPYDLDSDADGIVDVLEAGFADTDFNGKVDGSIGTKGWSTVVDAMATLTIRNTDGRGNADYLDIDADDDGIPDNVEGQTTNSYKFAAGADSDGDGIDNTYDLISGWGGAGVFLSDKDVDGIPDYRDLDTDSDGAPDITEGNDFNLNGIGDDNTTLTFLDTDGDGLDNRFDSLTSVTNIKGTSYRMGTGGSLTGDAAPGARCPVQKTVATQPDRDWRYTSYVLNVKLLQLSGVNTSDDVRLNWNIISTEEVERFDIERSTDNVHFSGIQTLVKPVPLNELSTYTANDDVSKLGSEYIFYRIKVIAKSGQVTYSNVLVIKRKIVKQTEVSIHPNPANDFVTIRFYAETDYEAKIKLIDNLGKVILLQNQKVSKGMNNISLTGLSRFSDATYSLQIIMQDQVVTQKLILTKH